MTTQDLIARLEGAEAGGRDLDAHVEVAVRAIEAARSGLKPEHWARWAVSRDFWVEDQHTAYEPKPHTRSMDAALALAERAHPGFHAALYTSDGTDQRQAMISVPTRKDGPFDARAATIPLALCSAILRAHTAQSAEPAKVAVAS